MILIVFCCLVTLFREVSWEDLAFFNADLFEGLSRMILDGTHPLMTSERFQATYCCHFEVPIHGNFTLFIQPHPPRVPKWFRVPLLRVKKNVLLQGSNTETFGALGLRDCTVGLIIMIFARAPSSKRVWAVGSTANISGLQGSKDTPL